MDAGLAGLLGALGGSLLSGTFVWLVGERQRKQQIRIHELQERAATYEALLVTSFNIAGRIKAVGDVRQLRSGLQEGVAVLLRQRRPVDPFEFYDWFQQDGARLNAAWMKVWAIGSQAAIDAADELVDSIGDLMAAAVAENPEVSQLRMTLFGVRRSAANVQAFDEAMKVVAERQVAFAHVLRKDGGNKAVEYALERARRSAQAQG